MSKKYTIRKLLNNVFNCNETCNLKTPIQFSILDENGDEEIETLRPIGVFETEQGENSDEICFGFQRVK
tara:strand:- start:454 stop:660 length:207 start_codon:yes stop_codon:yes gene_type:complete